MFHIVATIIIAVIAIIWSKEDWLNLLIKIVLFFVAAWGVIIIAQQYDFV